MLVEEKKKNHLPDIRASTTENAQENRANSKTLIVYRIVMKNKSSE